MRYAETPTCSVQYTGGKYILSTILGGSQDYPQVH